jgi:hypothetical protein
MPETDTAFPVPTSSSAKLADVYDAVTVSPDSLSVVKVTVAAVPPS